ncbi:hypothetical protein HDIA_0582 [Hartmannibacter diazotrophicus]|uniref:Uncharacterized protein n=1 Tax=Hartmannibacter diazotrophicus TaxID=1482074 RepID=A0A2C9D1M5_9HYPH|nr:hypothetical protein [Hartmannibacter diazotrophicus]SON54123.1 hypothetical protein HDIA_0582 [Hartmannibacter diazotrophicus]
MLRLFLKRLITCHWVVTLAVMCASVIIFSTASVNLFVMISGNLRFLAEHGVMAVMEGALHQSLQLFGLSLATGVSYVLFKACEHVLVGKLLS